MKLNIFLTKITALTTALTFIFTSTIAYSDAPTVSSFIKQNISYLTPRLLAHLGAKTVRSELRVDELLKNSADSVQRLADSDKKKPPVLSNLPSSVAERRSELRSFKRPISNNEVDKTIVGSKKSSHQISKFRELISNLRSAASTPLKDDEFLLFETMDTAATFWNVLQNGQSDAERKAYALEFFDLVVEINDLINQLNLESLSRVFNHGSVRLQEFNSPDDLHFRKKYGQFLKQIQKEIEKKARWEKNGQSLNANTQPSKRRAELRKLFRTDELLNLNSKESVHSELRSELQTADQHWQPGDEMKKIADPAGIANDPKSTNRTFEERMIASIADRRTLWTEGTPEDIRLGNYFVMFGTLGLYPDWITQHNYLPWMWFRGLKQNITFRIGDAHVLVMDNHNFALPFLLHLQRLGVLSSLHSMIHFDDHEDLFLNGQFRVADYFKITNEKDRLEYVLKNSTVGDWQEVLFTNGIVSAKNWQWQRIYNQGTYAHSSFSVTKFADIVDIDIDVLNWLDIELTAEEKAQVSQNKIPDKIKKRIWDMAFVASRAKVITIATSPSFTNQERALVYTKELLAEIVRIKSNRAELRFARTGQITAPQPKRSVSASELRSFKHTAVWFKSNIERAFAIIKELPGKVTDLTVESIYAEVEKIIEAIQNLKGSPDIQEHYERLADSLFDLAAQLAPFDNNFPDSVDSAVQASIYLRDAASILFSMFTPETILKLQINAPGNRLDSQKIEPAVPQKTGTEKVLLEIDHGVATIQFNDLANKNAMGGETFKAIPRILKKLGNNPTVKMVVFMGARNPKTGRRDIAGGNVKERYEILNAEQWSVLNEQLNDKYEMLKTISDFKKPIVTIFDGIAVGGALAIAGMSDFVLATDRTDLHYPEAAIGYQVDGGNAARIAQHFSHGDLSYGRAFSKYYAFTGTSISLSNAVRHGFVNKFIYSNSVQSVLDDLKRLATIRDQISFDDISHMLYARYQSPKYLSGYYRVNDFYRMHLHLLIEKYFSYESPEDIVKALIKGLVPESSSSSSEPIDLKGWEEPFVRKTLQKMIERSPFAILATNQLIEAFAELPKKGYQDIPAPIARYKEAFRRRLVHQEPEFPIDPRTEVVGVKATSPSFTDAMFRIEKRKARSLFGLTKRNLKGKGPQEVVEGLRAFVTRQKPTRRVWPSQTSRLGRLFARAEDALAQSTNVRAELRAAITVWRNSENKDVYIKWGGKPAVRIQHPAELAALLIRQGIDASVVPDPDGPTTHVQVVHLGKPYLVNYSDADAIREMLKEISRAELRNPEPENKTFNKSQPGPEAKGRRAELRVSLIRRLAVAGMISILAVLTINSCARLDRSRANLQMQREAEQEQEEDTVPKIDYSYLDDLKASYFRSDQYSESEGVYWGVIFSDPYQILKNKALRNAIDDAFRYKKEHDPSFGTTNFLFRISPQTVLEDLVLPPYWAELYNYQAPIKIHRIYNRDGSILREPILKDAPLAGGKVELQGTPDSLENDIAKLQLLILGGGDYIKFKDWLKLPKPEESHQPSLLESEIERGTSPRSELRAEGEGVFTQIISNPNFWFSLIVAMPISAIVAYFVGTFLFRRNIKNLLRIWAEKEGFQNEMEIIVQTTDRMGSAGKRILFAIEQIPETRLSIFVDKLSDAFKESDQDFPISNGELTRVIGLDEIVNRIKIGDDRFSVRLDHHYNINQESGEHEHWYEFEISPKSELRSVVDYLPYAQPLAFQMNIREAKEKFFSKITPQSHVFIVHDDDGDGFSSAYILKDLLRYWVPNDQIHLLSVQDRTREMETELAAQIESAHAKENFVIYTDIQGALSKFAGRMPEETKAKISGILSVDHHPGNEEIPGSVLVHPEDKWSAAIDGLEFPAGMATLFLAAALIGNHPNGGGEKAFKFFAKYLPLAIFTLHHDIFQLFERPEFSGWRWLIEKARYDFHYPIISFQQVMINLLLLDRLLQFPIKSHYVNDLVVTIASKLSDLEDISKAPAIYEAALQQSDEVFKQFGINIQKLAFLVTSIVNREKVKPISEPVVFVVIDREEIHQLGLDLPDSIVPKIRTSIAGRLAMNLGKQFKKAENPKAVVVFEQDLRDPNRWHVRLRSIRHRMNVSEFAALANVGDGRRPQKRDGLLVLNKTINKQTRKPYESLDEAIQTMQSLTRVRAADPRAELRSLKSKIEKTKRLVSELLTKSPDFDWEEAERKNELPIFDNDLLGPVKNKGIVNILPFPNFNYPWPILGSYERGWLAKIVKGEVKNGYYEMVVEFKKRGRKSFQKIFQIGRCKLLKELKYQSKKKDGIQGKTKQVLAINEHFGLEELEKLTLNSFDFDWEAAKKEGKIPNLDGLSIGPINAKGAVQLNPLANFPYNWYVLGFQDEGWRGVIVKSGVVNGIFQFAIQFEKAGKETFEKTFQIGSVPKVLRNRSTKKPFSVLEISDKLGTRGLAEVVTYHEKSDWEYAKREGSLPNLDGLQIGYSDKKGRFRFKLLENYQYTWSALGFPEKGWKGVILKSGVEMGVFEFTVEFSKSGQESFQKTFQVGGPAKLLTHTIDPAQKIPVLNISDKLGMRHLKEIISKPVEFNWEHAERNELIRDLAGFHIGVSDEKGCFLFSFLNGQFVFAWAALGFQESGWRGTIVDSKFEEGFLRFTVKFTKEHKQPIIETFQIGPYRRPLTPNQKEYEGFRPSVFDILNIRMIAKLAQIERLRKQYPKAGRVDAHTYQMVETISDPSSNVSGSVEFTEMTRQIDLAVKTLDDEGKEIVRLMSEGESDEQIVARGYDLTLIQSVRRTLQDWLFDYSDHTGEDFTNRAELRRKDIGNTSGIPNPDELVPREAIRTFAGVLREIDQKNSARNPRGSLTQSAFSQFDGVIGLNGFVRNYSAVLPILAERMPAQYRVLVVTNRAELRFIQMINRFLPKHLRFKIARSYQKAKAILIALGAQSILALGSVEDANLKDLLLREGIVASKQDIVIIQNPYDLRQFGIAVDDWLIREIHESQVAHDLAMNA